MLSNAIQQPPRVLLFSLAAAVSLLLATAFLLSLGSPTPVEKLPAANHPPPPVSTPIIRPATDRDTRIKEWPAAPPRVACPGPGHANDGHLHETILDGLPYPRPLFGSYTTLNLSQTWLTASSRYGPYGFRSPWNSTTDWTALQNACLALNAHRLANSTALSPGQPRFRLRGADETLPPPKADDSPTPAGTASRTAIVFRAWEGYVYTPEDLANLRATTAETGLRMGGEYSVFLLVDVKNSSRGVFTSPAAYQRALEELVPAEFRGMAVLFDETLLKSWYGRVGTHDATYQIMQPLQLFGAFYPEFGHVWQLELDLRFTGHAGRYLGALEEWGRRQPRKQAAERSTWFYMEGVHGEYGELVGAVNDSVAGGGGIGWGGVKVPEISSPIGPTPPVADPREDNFEWGVGDEADFIALVPCASMPHLRDWAWRNWQRGFRARPPGWMCQPAMGRASRALLGAVHHAQAERGLAMHSEATLSSFALWHGLKLVAPPQPIFQDPRWDPAAMNEVYNGAGKVAEHKTKGMVGMANGEVMYHMSPWDEVTQAASFWWGSAFPGRIYDAWLDRAGNGTAEVPYLLWKSPDGEVYAPNMMLHPIKTNKNMPLAGDGLVWVAIGSGVVGLVLGLGGVGYWWWRRRTRRGSGSGGSYALLKRDDSD
ncbi:hypothetical protein C8A05DRAFT_39692 [Staphylotrichum tortipilum]|uniref:Uncharacterized protein n=1 Tax=Staphylotrichum tortipilum TaxID=2831512 RepID=A0AAN6MAV2_9PEZI|nr:hypothetical protein C8A05DRAFT_39692 [Staphylotrichum longicolle]